MIRLKKSARIVKAVPPSHKWMREKLNVSGLKSQVRIKMKKTVVVQKSGANLHILRLDPKEDIFLGTCQQRFSASLCSPLQLESCYDLQAMESLHFNQKCAYVVAGSSHLLPYLHWALSIFIDPEKLWRLPNGRLACLALAIKHTLRSPLLLNTTSQCMCAHESASTNTRGGLIFWGPLQCISYILCPEPFYLFRVWLVIGGLANQSFRMEMPGACLSNTDKSDAKTFAF